MSNRKLVKKLRELQRIHFGLGQPFKGTAFAKLARIVESNGVDGALKALPKTSKASRAILLDYKRTGRIRRLSDARKAYRELKSRKSRRRSPKRRRTSPKRRNSLSNFIKLAKKYGITTNGSRKQIAERLSSLRGSYLSKTEKDLIVPYLSNSVNKRILSRKPRVSGGSRSFARRMRRKSKIGLRKSAIGLGKATVAASKVGKMGSKAALAASKVGSAASKGLIVAGLVTGQPEVAAMGQKGYEASESLKKGARVSRRVFGATKSYGRSSREAGRGNTKKARKHAFRGLDKTARATNTAIKQYSEEPESPESPLDAIYP